MLTFEEQGHILIYVPRHPFANKKYVPEHRLVMELSIGRFLTPDEVVHHKNEKKTDNHIENLELMTRGQHNTVHGKRGNV